MKHHWNSRSRGLALFLALVMCFGLLQATVFATGEDDSVGPPPETAGASEAAPVNGLDAVEQVTLTYDANCEDYAGTVPTSETTNKGEYVTLKKLNDPRDGYEFLGWNADKTATVVSDYAGDEIQVTEDTTLYAVWEPRANGVSTLPEAPNSKNTNKNILVSIVCQDAGGSSHSAPANLFYDGKTTIVPGEVVENGGTEYPAEDYPYQCTVQLDGEFYVGLWNKNLQSKYGVHKLYEQPKDITFYYSASTKQWTCSTNKLQYISSYGKYGWPVKIKKVVTAHYQVEWYSTDGDELQSSQRRMGVMGDTVAPLGNKTTPSGDYKIDGYTFHEGNPGNILSTTLKTGGPDSETGNNILRLYFEKKEESINDAT